MTRQVILSPEAEADLTALYTYIEAHGGAARAFGYTDRIAAFCEGLGEFSERGHRRDDVRAGLRVVGFERRVAIAFHVAADTVTIDRILYGGRDLGAAFEDGGL